MAMASALTESKHVLFDANMALSRIELKVARDRRHTQIELGFTDLGHVDLEQLLSEEGVPASTSISSRKTLPSGKADESTSSAVSATTAESTANRPIILLKDGKRSVERVLEQGNKLVWWKLPFGKADDVAPELGVATQGYFGDLERKVSARGL